MISLRLKLDADRHPFDALSEFGDGPRELIHLGSDAHIEVGTLRGGMASGKDSVALCLKLPDGRVVIAETSAELFIGAGRAIAAWQEGRRERGED